MLELTATVFVVDDDISVRESLEGLIRLMGWDVLTFDSAEAFLAAPRASGPGCLVLDVSMPHLNGLDLQTRLADDRAAIPIIFIAGFSDVSTSVRAMKAGASDFLTKPLVSDALLAAIEAALDQSRTAVGVQTKVRAIQARYDTLSRRERQVMALVTRGLMNKQVGGELGISEITVKAHRGRVMGKMAAGSLPDLINIGARLSLSTLVEP